VPDQEDAVMDGDHQPDLTIRPIALELMPAAYSCLVATRPRCAPAIWAMRASRVPETGTSSRTPSTFTKRATSFPESGLNVARGARSCDGGDVSPG
jgi:hypothetical protein